MAFADDLLRDAHHLEARGGKNPKHSLRRAVSTAYYALFHLLVADFTANWRLTGERARLGRNPTPVEKELEKIVGAFAKLQDDRYKADYHVGWTWSRTDVKAFRTWRSIRNQELAQHHLMSMFGARH